MSMINTSLIKQPYKLIEIPLNKFHEEAIPHHERVYKSHKNTVEELISLNDVQQLCREIADKKRVMRQLKDLMYELDTLRTQVEDSDLDRFDSQTLSLRKIILRLISGYMTLDTEGAEFIKQKQEIKQNHNPLEGASQIQIQETLDLGKETHKLQRVEALNKDIEDVHGIFVDLNQMVVEQKEQVNTIESNVEVTNENVQSGLKQLIKASRLKRASYPLAGACIGTVVAGPIGAVAGLKIGGLAAIGFGVIGYVSGRFIKKSSYEQSSFEGEELNVKLSEGDDTKVIAGEKKDI